MKDEKDCDMLVSVRLPAGIVKELPAGKTKSEQVKGALWQYVAMKNRRTEQHDAQGLTQVLARLNAMDRRIAGADPRRAIAALVELHEAAGEDMLRTQQHLVSILRNVETGQSPHDQRTIDELNGLATRLCERNRRLLEEARSILADEVKPVRHGKIVPCRQGGPAMPID